MTTEILINAASYEVRLALVEDGTLCEYYMQRPAECGFMGNIYKGRVTRVLPGMQAAFIDIGLERTGFLHVDDICITSSDAGFAPCITNCTGTDIRAQGLHIEDLLQENQEILVQVSKDPIGTKGARLTCHISLPCRNLVFLPQTDHIGISRKIEDEESRKRIKALIGKMRPQEVGFIARTMAETASVEEIEADMEYLLMLWEELLDKTARLPSPSLVHQDLDIIFRAVRDFFNSTVDRLIIDNADSYQSLLRHARTFAPPLLDRIELYQDPVPLFEAHNIEVEITRAIDKKVWLRSGGYIIIESTEALTVIDVNTGRFVGKNDFNTTIFKTNMEAAAEIAHQLRLRNIGGIIIIDFIDMESDEHREELYSHFIDAVKHDKSKINILRLSEFGLVQMTRKRSSDNLHQLMCETCKYCAGEGMLRSRRTICYDIFRQLQRDAGSKNATRVQLRVNPAIAAILQEEELANVSELEKQIQKNIEITAITELHIERYEILWLEN